METGQHEQFQAYVKVAHIDDFEKIGLHADFGELLDDGSGLLGETEVDVTTVAHDALKESDARFVAAKIKAKKICAHKFPQYSLFTSAVHMRNLVC